MLHNDCKKKEKQPLQHTTTQMADQTRNEDIDLPLALQHTYREPKPFATLKDFIKTHSDHLLILLTQIMRYQEHITKPWKCQTYGWNQWAKKLKY